MTADRRPDQVRLLGAEGALELIEFLTGTAKSARITRNAGPGRPALTVRLERVADAPGPADAPAAHIDAAPGPVAANAAGPPNVLDRHLLSYEPEAPAETGAGVPFAPPRTLVVVAGDIELDAGRLAAADTAVLRAHGDGWLLSENGGTTGIAHEETALAAALTALDPAHVRVIVRLDPVDDWTTVRDDTIMTGHEAAFLAARSTQPATCQMLILGGADATGRPHPYAGLFTGLGKALTAEPYFAAVDTLVLLTDEREAGPGIALLEHESGVARTLPVTVRANGIRRVERTRPAPLPTPAPLLELPADAVIVGAGASRGIGMAMMLALAERYRPILHIVGSTDLSRFDDAALAEDDAAHGERRRTLLREAVGRPGGVAAANAELTRLGHARTIRATLRELERHAGAGRVHYHPCDVTDAAAVTHLAAEVHRLSGPRIDLLFHLAGVNRTADLENKRLSDFRAVRDLKVRSYRNLKAAFAAHPPRRWINTSSIAAVLGVRGEADYAAGNAFLLSSGGFEAARGGAETTFAWGLWGDAGRSTEAAYARVLDANADMAPMPAVEGIAHLLGELGAPEPGVCPVFLGATERAAIERDRPGVLALWKTVANEPQQPAPGPRFFVDAVAERAPDRLVIHRDLDLGRDGYLEDHLIQGHPTMPGLILTEMAAEAATELVPGRVPVAFEDLAFDRFVRVYRTSARPERKKLVAELVTHEPGSEGRSVVDVAILSDVIAPDGTVLATDKPHARMRVILRESAPACPRPDPALLPSPTDGVELANPYQVDSPFARLGGVFAAFSHITVGSAGNLAALRLNRERLGRWFTEALVPAVLCDAVAQGAVAASGDDWSAIVVPRSVGRIDVYGGLNDFAVSAGDLTLHTRPPRRGAKLYTNDWAAVTTTDGRLVLRMTDLAGDVIGYVHRGTGEFRSAAEHERTRPPTVPVPVPPAAPTTPRAEDEPAVRPNLLAYDGIDFARPVDRYVTEPIPRPLIRAHHDQLFGRTVLLLGLPNEHTRQVATGLRDCGITVHTATGHDDLAAVAAGADSWDGIIDLGMMGAARYTLGDDGWREAYARTVAAIKLVYAAWQAESAVARHFYLAVGHQDGLFGRSEHSAEQPLSGAWTGVAKTLPIELPTVAVKAVDLDRSDATTTVEIVCAETGDWHDLEVGYRDGIRHVLTLRAAPLRLPEDHAGAIGPEDCVLISGGGRGVGFELAKALARTGARVVVTGRAPCPGTALADDDTHARHRRDVLREAATRSGDPDRIRAAVQELEAGDRLRELQRNLEAARADGLVIDYEVCDIVDRTSVDALFDRLASPPTILVHNAGVYRGVRTPAQTDADLAITMDTKVIGFEHLLAATLLRTTPRMVCAVSSVSGRLGGMIGHFPYAAANNALTQLACWAERRYGIPVRSICWPTWERVGNIVNYEGAAQYCSTVLPEEAVAHWQAELSAPHDPGVSARTAGEATYLGRLGVVWRPGSVRTIVLPGEHPDAVRTTTSRRLLGDVGSFLEHRLFTTRHRLAPGSEPHLIAGGALPLGMLLEYALAAGDWVRPENRARQHLLEIADLRVDLPAVRIPHDDELEVEITARGTWTDGHWAVRVTLAGIGEMTLRYTANPVPPGYEPTVTDGTAIPRHHDGDLWCTPGPPRASLPHPALAAILADALTAADTATDSAAGQRLSVDRLVVLPGCLAADTVHRTAGGYRADADGVPVMTVERLRLAAIDAEPTPATMPANGFHDLALVDAAR
ncbi:SDR family NAD(P)-dependent oxidoreductase [Nocardia sp. NPDC056611]|uniref:SDR family NAD(P)-dependent oxidoreductase n=1 Tax=Nocardia sp. NPDC056611 TaxID=3345877 RepID=UPI00366ED805